MPTIKSSESDNITIQRKSQYVPKQDDAVIIFESKKRGRKRGRKKKNSDLIFRPDEIIDYMVRNFPYMGIDKIKDKVLNGMNILRNMGNSAYLLYQFTYEGVTYYYDDMNAVLNTDAQVIGYLIDQTDGGKKLYLLHPNTRDNRTYQQVINDIELKKN